jgi:hypothetical protein
MTEQQETEQKAQVIKKAPKTVITIDSDVHAEVIEYCQQNGIKIGFFAKQALMVALKKAISSKHLTA